MRLNHIGIDVNETNLVAALVTPEGHILTKASLPTRPDRKPEAIVADIKTLVIRVSGGYHGQVKSIGIGIPGIVDNLSGRVLHTSIMPLNGAPLTSMLETQIPVFLGSCVNVTALGEYMAGSARGTSSMVMVTLGTCVNGGTIMNGRIVEGVGGATSEIGHMVVCRDGLPCSCGRRGCWEMYASARALIRMTNEAMQRHPNSLLHEALTGDPPYVNGRTAFWAASRADVAAQMVIDEYLSWLAEGILNIMLILQPEMVCIGGGISREGDYLLTSLRTLVETQRFYEGTTKQSKLEIARLGNDAGLIGASLLGESYCV